MIASRTRTAKLPPVRTIRERIDKDVVAAIAYSLVVRRRFHWDKKTRNAVKRAYLYGISVFVLVPANYRRWQSLATDKLMEAFRRHGNRLPVIGPCSHIPGWGDYE